MQTSLKPEEDYLDEDKPFRHMVKKQNFCIFGREIKFDKL